jgi:succinate dehydrogenase / fumarate reductase cytochrome b subunit
MSLTGCFLILFVTFHALMNGVAIFWPTAYNVICEFLGANWYALVGGIILALGVILHICYATWLTLQNRKARGNSPYAVTARQPQVEWSSKNMFVLGIVVIAFFVLHLIQFWSKMQLAEITGNLATCPESGATLPPAAGTLFLQQAFSCPWTLVVYVIAFVALWFHLTHGFWSMFQTCGWNGKIWMNRLKTIGNVWSTVVVALFIIEAVVFTINAKNETYRNCPELQKQYVEMSMQLDEANAPACPMMGQPCDKPGCPEGRPACDKPGKPGCDKPCCKGGKPEGKPACACPDCKPGEPCVPGCDKPCCKGGKPEGKPGHGPGHEGQPAPDNNNPNE